MADLRKALESVASRAAAEEFYGNVQGNTEDQAALGIELVSIRIVEVEASV